MLILTAQRTLNRLEKLESRSQNAACFIQPVMTSLLIVCVGIPGMNMKFLKLENDLLCNQSEFNLQGVIKKRSNLFQETQIVTPSKFDMQIIFRIHLHPYYFTSNPIYLHPYYFIFNPIYHSKQPCCLVREQCSISILSNHVYVKAQ